MTVHPLRSLLRVNALAWITLSEFSLYSFTESTVGLRDKDGVCIYLYLLDDISQIIDNVTKIFRSKRLLGNQRVPAGGHGFVDEIVKVGRASEEGVHTQLAAQDSQILKLPTRAITT